MNTGKVNLLEYLDRESGLMTFGKFMVAARTLVGFSQSDLARKLKVSRSMICDIEKGRSFVSLAFAAKIAKRAGFPESFAVKYAIEDQLRKARIKMTVEVKLKVA